MKEIELNISNPFKNKTFVKVLAATVVIGLTVAGTYVFANNYTLGFRSPIILQNPIVIEERLIELKIVEPTMEVKEATESAKVKDELDILYTGKISYYSHDGCLGCGESQIMGNGEPFDENGMTLAIPCEDILSGKYEYNTVVKVVNQDNFRHSEAVITDCGGFSKYDRVADLSLGLAEKLQATTDKSEIVIYK